MSWIFSIVRVLHILSCFFLILVVLLQAGKGAGIGSAFGGAGSAVFGGRGASGFISKVTWVVAGIFMMTSVSLAWRSTQRGSELLKTKSKPVSAEKLLMEEAPADTKDATDIEAPDAPTEADAPLEGSAAEDGAEGEAEDQGEADTEAGEMREERTEEAPAPAASSPRPAKPQTTRTAAPRPRDVRMPPEATKSGGDKPSEPEEKPRARPRRVVPAAESAAPARPARPASTSSDGE